MPFDVEKLLRRGVSSLEAYVPGRSIEDVSREYGISDVVKLASNENALGPSPAAAAAIREALGGLHRYPDGAAKALVARLEERLGLGPGQVFVGNGGDDVLSVLARTYINEGERVILPQPTFSPYAHVSRVMGAEVVFSPLSDFAIDLDDIRSKVTAETKLVFLCSPNNPTGVIIKRGALAAFLEGLPEGVLVLLDEAYGDFVDDPDWPDSISLVGDYPLVVLRSFSKIYGLAGLRVGYGVSRPEVVDYMNRVREPFNVNLLAQAAALAALDDEDYRRRAVETVRAGRKKLYAAFSELGLKWLESQANFIFVQVGDSEAVSGALMQEGVIVRPGGAFGCPEWIRVTVGLPEEDERLVRTLARILS